MPPVSVELNIAIRNRVRADLLLPRPVDRAGEPTIEDLTAEQLAELEKLRLFNARFLASVRSGDPNAISDTRPQPPAGLPRGSGEFFAFSDDNSTFNPNQTSFFGPINFPYIVRELSVSAMDAAVAPAQGNVLVELWSSGEGPDHLSRRPTGAKLWPGEPAPTSEATTLITGSGGPVFGRFPVNRAVLTTGLYLAVFFDASAATLDAAAVVTIERVGSFGAQAYADLLPAGRVNINANTRAAAPRSTAPPVPRGAIISVTQGGRILAQRTLAWLALDSSIRAKWFNQQVGEPPDPSITWLR